MIRTQVYLPNDMYQEIGMVSRQENKAAAQIVREFLADGLARKKKKNSIGNALLELSKIHGRGSKNLSTSIDTELYSS